MANRYFKPANAIFARRKAAAHIVMALEVNVCCHGEQPPTTPARPLNCAGRIATINHSLNCLICRIQYSAVTRNAGPLKLSCVEVHSNSGLAKVRVGSDFLASYLPKTPTHMIRVVASHSKLKDGNRSGPLPGWSREMAGETRGFGSMTVVSHGSRSP